MRETAATKTTIASRPLFENQTTISHAELVALLDQTRAQAIGTSRKNPAGAVFLRDFVEEAKSSGLVARLIERYEVRGLSVAPSAGAHS